MKERLPISALLSFAWVAFTIEFDNEFEHLVPHRTTNHGAAPGVPKAPWLVSMVMWSNFMQFVGDEGTTLPELEGQLRMPRKNVRNWVTRMEKWWGYVRVESGGRLLPTVGGLKAIQAWRNLNSVIEKRWRERFGETAIDQLEQALTTIVEQIAVELPDGLPTLGYGLYSSESKYAKRSPKTTMGRLPLSSLLAKALLWFAIEFEQNAEVSLAISANVLRLVDDEGSLVRALPGLSAVSKEAIATSLSFLVKRGYAAKGGKMLLLTPKGRAARDTYSNLVWAIEKSWQKQFGAAAVDHLRTSLECLAIAVPEPYPDNWRASLPRVERLPHYPMVLHRGGFPDGS